MICPNCGANRGLDDAFCTQCGQKIDVPKEGRVVGPEAVVPYHVTSEIVPDGLPEHISKLRHPLEWPSYVFAAIMAPAVIVFLGWYGPQFVFLVVRPSCSSV